MSIYFKILQKLYDKLFICFARAQIKTKTELTKTGIEQSIFYETNGMRVNISPCEPTRLKGIELETL